MDLHAERRRHMVEETIANRGVRDARVLEAMREVPRHLFVPSALQALAYQDSPLPIGEGQTISQPYMVAIMAEALRLSERDRVLEVGTGSGYGAAVLGRLAAEVFTLERRAALAQRAAQTLAALAANNVWVAEGDGTLGLSAHAPYDGIAVTAGGEKIPEALLWELAPGGRLVIPVGPADAQVLVRITRTRQGPFEREELAAVRFVPLVSHMGQ